MKVDPGVGGKYRVARDDLITWLENATEHFDNKAETTRAIERAFGKYGQDPRSSDQSHLMEYLAGHEENGIYGSLLENQTAVELS